MSFEVHGTRGALKWNMEKMYNFLCGVVSGKQGEPGFAEALAVANVQQAIMRSWQSSRWETVTA